MPTVLPAVCRPPTARPPGVAVVVATGPALAAHVPAWEALAAGALEPNAFFEPWLLLPALGAFGAGVRVVFVYATLADGSRTLAGVFPIERRRTYRGLPVPCVRLWLHRHAYLGTPLLHPDHAALALAALRDWAAEQAPLLELPRVAADGPVAGLLADLGMPLITDRQDRGLLVPGPDADTYLRTTLSGPTRRALERRRRRLAEVGRLTVEAADDAPVAAWVEEFLHLEASGWKGRQRTALAATGADTVFFRRAAHAAGAGRLLRLTLRLDGRPIAARFSFRTGAAAFSFKSAYDEALAVYSPGVLLEVENVRQCHALAGLTCMDSCTSPDNDVINRLWRDRRSLQTVTFAVGRLGEPVIHLLRRIQDCRNLRRLRKSKSALPVSPSQETSPCLRS